MSQKLKQQHLVESKSVKLASLHILLPFWRHLYVWPFVFVAYPALQFAYVFHFEKYFASEEYRFLLIGGTFVLHALSYLSCHWSNGIRVNFTCALARNAQEATHIRIEPTEHHGRGEICPLQRLDNVVVEAGDIKIESLIYFEYHRKKYFYDLDRKSFRKLSYPINHIVGEYKKAKGLSIEECKDLRLKYGENKPDIPIPTFQELFQEHAVAPFFVFQIFCVALWFMDEYWYYSLFTLVMLFVFESTVVFQRLRNLTELRSMAQQPYNVMAYRDGSWVELKSDMLLPGDLVSVVRQKNDEITLPCDILLLTGHCIVNEAMLSGESTPLQKECIEERKSEEVFHIKSSDFKQHILFGGTKVIQHSLTPENNHLNIPQAPDGGCVGYVLRTGFGTTQGKLVRTMIFSTERVSANNTESLFFILILVVFALAAAYYVWTTGLEAGRKKSKLLLDCIIIVTSVVPPELPLELSLAVNQSLVALSRLAIFCLEPFRIPFAGKVDVCCFDKTGTLTQENLVLEGVAGVGDDKTKLHPAREFPLDALLVVASCHSVMLLDDGLIGDPMEKTVLNDMHWTVGQNDVVYPRASPNKSPNVKIVKRYPFLSSLKRMSALTTVEMNPAFLNNYTGDKSLQLLFPNKSTSKSDTYFVAVKGAPEVMRGMLKTIPDYYDSTYRHLALSGSRVLALGWKWISAKQSSLKDLPREKVESELHFAGFLVFHCPLKEDTVMALEELHESMHRIIMITGDSALTACHVAEKVKIIRRKALIIDVDDDGILCAETTDESTKIPITDEDCNLSFLNEKFMPLIKKHDLAITGKAMARLEGTNLYLKVLLSRIWVYARVSPSQKEYALTSLKNAGYSTLMAGDGTNDVGALKQAHVGVALLDGTKEDLEKISRLMRERRMQEMKKKQEELYKSWGIEPPVAGNETPQQKALKKQQKAMEDMMDKMGAQADDIPMIKFGDASVAAPFTSKLSSVMSICQILRQGRCTLVTTIQMYKILALNCLINAFSLSALYLDGIKHGDTQMTIQGFLIAGCFMFLSWGKPIDRLSRKRPQANIFNLYIMSSILGQFLVHTAALWFVVVEAKKFLPLDWKVDLEDTKFEPNILNTAVYLISLSMQVSTFMINYQVYLNTL